MTGRDHHPAPEGGDHGAAPRTILENEVVRDATVASLATQVAKLTEQLGKLLPGTSLANSSRGIPLETPELRMDDGIFDQGAVEPSSRRSKPSLPDPRLLRRIIRQRQLRARFFDGELFADPAWDMLLDLSAAHAEYRRVSVTSLCIASSVPPTTALRWITQMTESGLFKRVEDDTDKRRVFIALTDAAKDSMARYFAELGEGAQILI